MTDSDDKKPLTLTPEDLIEKLELVSESFILATILLENSREFCSVARLAVSTSNNELAIAVLTSLLGQLDSHFQGFYEKSKDEDFITIVTQKMSDIKHD